jgi:hypothetical protein
MWNCIPHSQRSSYDCSSPSSTRCVKTLRHLLWCFRNQTWLCAYARQPSNCIRITSTQGSWIELPYPWSWTRNYHSCPEDLETSSDGYEVPYLYWPQKPQIHLHASKSEYEAMTLARTYQRLWFGSTLSSRQGQCHCGCTQSQGTLLLLICRSFQRDSLLGDEKA